jgi:hypothetical protein
MTETALNGRLEDTPLAEVAGRLFQNSKTGRLVLTSNERSRQVVFYEGSPVAVLSDDPKDHIGHFLTLKGKVSQEEGARLQELPETKEALQSADFLTKEVLTWGLKFRFVNLAYDLFRWDEGTWGFEESPPPKDVFLMKVPTPTLVAKGVKYMSPSLLMQRIPSDRVIGPGTLSREEAAFLTDEEKTLLEHCTEGKRIREVIEAEVADPVRTRELFYVLLALGLVSAATPSPEASPEPVVDDMLEETPENLVFSPEEPAASPEEPAAPLEEPAAPPLETAPTEETAAPTEGTGESFEIERHTYGEPEAPAPPDGLDMPETLQPLGGEEELQAPGLEMPAPPETEAKEPLSPEAARFIDPDEAPPPQDGGELEPPGLEMPPPPSPDLPPPPWQESADTESADDTFSLGEDQGVPEGGQSPFAPPESSSGKEGSAPRKRPSAGKAPVPKRKPAIPSRLMLLLAAVGATVVVGAGVYVGSQSFRSPSAPLPPIPAAEELQPELAENLPVPALPTAAGKAEAPETSKPEPSQAPSPPPAAVQLPASAPPPPPAPEPEPEPPAAPPSASGSSYEEGLAAFQGGDYQGAAVLWREMLAGGAETHSVSVVVACQIDTVKSAFTRYGADRNIFAIPLKLSDGRDCFRVCMGLFGSKGEAQAAIKALPPTLRSDLSVRSVKSLIK